jgi:hypothetical protein
MSSCPGCALTTPNREHDFDDAVDLSRQQRTPIDPAVAEAQGVGSLYVRHGAVLEPLIHSAGHELGRCAERACGWPRDGLRRGDLAPMERVGALRDRFWAALQDQLVIKLC